MRLLAVSSSQVCLRFIVPPRVTFAFDCGLNFFCLLVRSYFKALPYLRVRFYELLGLFYCESLDSNRVLVNVDFLNIEVKCLSSGILGFHQSRDQS